jgi:4-amino-4-deoxychorismate lyase
VTRPTRRVLDSAEAIELLRHRSTARTPARAMFSSYLGGVVTDPALMVVPIDDHLVHRGHGVFDTATLTDGRLYRLGIHTDRLLRSATLARIEHPWSHDDIVEMVVDTAAASGLRDGSVRYWLSPGPGGFGFSPSECEEACFYCVIFDPTSLFAGGVDIMREGFSEVTVRDTPMKPELLATIKSNNYLLNVLTHMEAVDKGGMFGILVTDDGYLAEACVLNASFVTDEGDLVTPPFDGILSGTTVRRILQLAEEVLIPEGLVRSAGQAPIRADSRRGTASRELFLSGGDTHIFPVTSWDGVAVGDGTVGPVARRLLELLEGEASAGPAVGSAADFLEVPYS